MSEHHILVIDDDERLRTLLRRFLEERGFRVTVAGNAEAEEVGQLTLADFSNRRGLQPIGENFLTETEASGPAVISNPQEEGAGKIMQGALEASNANVVQELVEMIETQRAYEVSSKAITSVDEMLRFIANNL